MTESAEVGSVVALWRYPVKSMLGEELNASEVTDRGLLGDRAFSLIDASDGKIASAKNPRKWPRLLDCSASLVDSPRRGAEMPRVRITLPDGSAVTNNQGDVNRVLSGAFGREVRLEALAPGGATLEEYWPDIEGLAHQEAVTDERISLGAPAGTFFDYAAVHVLTTATLDRLRQLYPQGRFEARRFRPNIVIGPVSGEKGFVEQAWVNRTLLIGDEVRMSVSIPCPRCVMTTLAQGDLPRDPGILRTAAQHTGRVEVQGQVLAALVGVYATVLCGGTVRRDDPVRLE